MRERKAGLEEQRAAFEARIAAAEEQVPGEEEDDPLREWVRCVSLPCTGVDWMDQLIDGQAPSPP